MILLLPRRRWSPSRLLSGSLILAILAGCSGPEDYSGLTEREKAGLITRLRKQADDQLAIFMQSGGTDLAALEEHVRLHGETTRVAPATCGRCFEYYGRALSRLGRFYEIQLADLQKERDTAPPERLDEIEAEIAKANKLRLDAYTKSNQQFEVLFRSGEPVNPDAYEWMSGQCAALGDYRRALYYLDLFVQSYPLDAEGQKNAKVRRAAFEREIRRQEEEELQRELSDDGSRTPSQGKSKTQRGN